MPALFYDWDKQWQKDRSHSYLKTTVKHLFLYCIPTHTHLYSLTVRNILTLNIQQKIKIKKRLFDHFTIR